MPTPLCPARQLIQHLFLTRWLPQSQGKVGSHSVSMKCKIPRQRVSSNRNAIDQITLSDSHLTSVTDHRDLPAGTENYCFYAGGPNVPAASAPPLTHSPTTSGASNVTDCAYTTQPTPGWTPSITATTFASTALQISTSSDSQISNTVGFITSVTPAPSSTPILPSYDFNCTQM